MMEKMNSTHKYFRKKRFLQESAHLIKETLRRIQRSTNQTKSDEKTTEEALRHAMEIQSSIWNPKLKITAEEFQRLTIEKTLALCASLNSAAGFATDNRPLQLQYVSHLLLKDAENNTNSDNKKKAEK